MSDEPQGTPAPAAATPADGNRPMPTSTNQQSVFMEAFAEAKAEADAAAAPSPTADETKVAEDKVAADKVAADAKTTEDAKSEDDKAAESKAADDKKAEDAQKLVGKTEEDIAKLTSASEEDLAKLAEAEKAKADADVVPEKTAAEEVLELLGNKELLDTALRKAGVDTINELPAVKELLGRERQSTEDRVKAELAKAQWQQQAVKDVAAKGQQAAQDVYDQLDALAKEIADDVDGTAELHVPNKEFIAAKMQEFSEARVNAYHNETWGALADMIYGLPELNAAPAELKAELAKFAGRPPNEWLGAHLEAARQTLWSMAQGQVAEAAKKAIADDKLTLETAHKVEVEKLTKKAEKTQKDAVEEARKTARAEAFAEFSKGGPPKLPTKEGASTETAEEITGNTIADIFRSARAQAEKTGAV